MQMFLPRAALLGIITILQLGKLEALVAVLQLKLTIYRTPYLEPYLHFTAYSVTSESPVIGSCARHTDPPILLLDAYIVSIVYTYDYGSAPTLAYSTFLDDTYSSFNAFLGYEGCIMTVPPSPVVPDGP